ncbi:LysR family transcriptional regulator [Cohaesibacter gelatinilyticus]|uniref:DNA-binding transcriptional regulator, LysR family n=1 Tax=Cohaesibacter gelatinilyticus TaxID=372072 RepID=A0A285PGB3_9HYPH|nr:LysR family transcriptional regulator [Cohaesibacter gelatinilyticus]SNZ19186.1 DNA-binding transcriptional regulator, LysR family [Cohaesibacter gelatinilyticus]HAT87939.1 LysR family transcriptional regulator [Hyphomicrobiales bacterium]
MSFDFKTLELFVRVAKLGALGRAGEELLLSPTATTQRIQLLEAELGSKLLNRTTRAVSLTPDGEAFLEHAQKILDTIEDARSVVSSSKGRVSGLLRVTASASFGRAQIIPHLGAFFHTYPEIRLKLDLNDAVIDIVEQGYDLAIRVGVLTSSTLLARKLAPNPRFLVASPDYLEKFGEPRTPADLKNHNCITFGENRNWTLTGPRNEEFDIQVTGTFTTNFGEAITEALLQDLGIGLKSIWDISDHLQSGRLVKVLPDYSIAPDWQIWAVRAPSRMSSPRVLAFTNFFGERFKQGG